MFHKEKESVLSCIMARPRWPGTLQKTLGGATFARKKAKLQSFYDATDGGCTKDELVALEK
jgi:hypothetical protein